MPGRWYPPSHSAASPETAALVTGALGERAGAVEADTRLCLLDATVPDAVAASRDLVRRARGTGSGRLRVVGQVRVGHEPLDRRDALRYEAAVNLLMAVRPVSGLCLFDRRELPAEVFAEVARVLRPGGRFVCSFSNRLFATKAIRGWLVASEPQRCAIAVSYFRLIDGFGDPEVETRIPAGRTDPLYAVWATAAA